MYIVTHNRTQNPHVTASMGCRTWRQYPWAAYTRHMWYETHYMHSTYKQQKLQRCRLLPAYVRKDIILAMFSRFSTAGCWHNATRFVITNLYLIETSLSKPSLDCDNSPSCSCRPSCPLMLLMLPKLPSLDCDNNPSPKNARCIITRLQKCLSNCRDAGVALE